MEHRLAEKDLPDGDTIQSANQIAIKITFEGMGDTQFMQVTIGLNHLIHNPSAVLSLAGRVGAMCHHLAEIGVNS